MWYSSTRIRLAGLACPSQDVDEKGQLTSREPSFRINQSSLDRQSGKHLMINQYILFSANLLWTSIPMPQCKELHGPGRLELA